MFFRFSIRVTANSMEVPMPDPRIDYWTAAWKEAVTEHIFDEAWRKSVALLGLSDDERRYLVDMLCVMVRLPADVGSDVALIINAWQKGQMSLIRDLYGHLSKSRLSQLEALARGEAKSVHFSAKPPEEPVRESLPSEPDGRPTPIFDFAPYLGESMRSIAPQSVAQPAPLPTIPVPAGPDPELIRLCQPSSPEFAEEEPTTTRHGVITRGLSGLSHLFLHRDYPQDARFADPEIETGTELEELEPEDLDDTDGG
jgi:hypothetical protein